MGVCVTPSFTQEQLNTVLGDFLQNQVGVPAVVGQVNRVPSLEGDYMVYWPLRRPRLSTNVVSEADCKFTGAIAGTALTVDLVETGVIVEGTTVTGPNISSNTLISSQNSGPSGGAGVYVVSVSQTVSQETMFAGAELLIQSTEAVMQVDVHGPNSADNVQAVSTLMRSGYAVDLMSPLGVVPLYTDDPIQIPFITAAQQYEDRWTCDVHLQIDPSISVPQEYADTVTVTTIEVESTYPVN